MLELFMGCMLIPIIREVKKVPTITVIPTKPVTKIAQVMDTKSRFFGKKGLIVRDMYGRVMVRFPTGPGTSMMFNKTDLKIFEIPDEDKQEALCDAGMLDTPEISETTSDGEEESYLLTLI